MAKRATKNSRRNVVVYFSLVAGLIATSLFLRALSPKPLAPAAVTLFAADVPESNSIEAIFATRLPIQAERWQSIYIHQSATVAGDAGSLAQGGGELGDHFLIGNGEGCPDGAVQMSSRWTSQQAAAFPADGRALRDECISICLVGDLDRAKPTALQLQRLSQLVGALQTRLLIKGDRIVTLAQPQGNPAGIGRNFPISAFLSQLPH